METAMPKFRTAADDATARESVETLVTDELIDNSPVSAESARGVAKDVVGMFPFAEVETTVSKVAGGGAVPLRRFVLTTAWEVDLNAPSV
jgi:hypothetical protein